MAKDEIQIGRIALRHEGDWWVSYFASQDTMEGALELSRVKFSLAVQHPDIKKAFINFNRRLFDQISKDLFGVVPSWHNPVSAPESERSGHG